MMSSALGYMFELIREANRFLDTKPSGQKAKDLVTKTRELLAEAGEYSISSIRPQRYGTVR